MIHSTSPVNGYFLLLCNVLHLELVYLSFACATEPLSWFGHQSVNSWMESGRGLACQSWEPTHHLCSGRPQLCYPVRG